MKKVFRCEVNRDYWDRRWAEARRDPDRFVDLSVYPIRYAQMVMQDPRQRALELGAGLGRLLKHYHYAGYDIAGVELSEVAVRKLRSEDPGLRVYLADARHLPFDDEQFDVLLSFGVYHNLEKGLGRALAEGARCLKRGGYFCISMRPDNVEMRLNEWYWRMREPNGNGRQPTFHKWLVRDEEFRTMLAQRGLEVAQLFRARNLSLLFRFPWLRERGVDETQRRGSGYRLNGIGRVVDRLLVGLAPAEFCNVLVFVGRKR